MSSRIESYPARSVHPMMTRSRKRPAISNLNCRDLQPADCVSNLSRSSKQQKGVDSEPCMDPDGPLALMGEVIKKAFRINKDLLLHISKYLNYEELSPLAVSRSLGKLPAVLLAKKIGICKVMAYKMYWICLQNRILPHPNSVEKFHVRGDGPKPLFRQCMQTYPNITMLDIQRCSGIDDIEPLSQLTKLKELHLGEADALHFLPNSRILEVLSITRCCDDRTLTSLKRFINLKSLDSSYCEMISDDGLAALSFLPNFETLSFNRCKKLTDIGLQSLASCTNLTSLRLVICPEITNVGLHSLALLKLSYLRLGGCPQITDDGVRSIGQISTLQLLHLEYFENITDGCLDALSKLSNITYLCFDSCKLLTAHGVNSLALALKLPDPEKTYARLHSNK